MKLLKENYEGLHEFVRLSEPLKKLLAKPEIQKALKNSDFETLYIETWKRTSYSTIGEVTQLLINLNINPLDHLSSIPKGFLTNTSIKHIDIPDHITSIDEFAFAHCGSLTSVTIPDSVTSIGEAAFCDCSSLTSITIPNSVTSIGQSAFSGCTGLKNIIIPNSVTSIGTWAFGHCSSLTSIKYTGTKNQWHKIYFRDEWYEDSPIETIHCIDGDIEL